MTLVETIIYAAMGCIVSLVSYSALRSSAVLAVKNTNLNRSHDDLRSAYDRLARELLSANNVPTLVSATGATVATGPAAGFSFDRNLGSPYLLGANPSAASSIAATDSSVIVCFSTTSMSRTPIPKIGEILIIPTPSGSIRARISNVSNATAGVAANTLRVTLTFTAPLGKSMNWGANEPQTAKLIRPEAFIVIGSELRYYASFEPVPDLTNSANYKVLTDQISTMSGEQTPFDVADFSGDKILTSTLQVRERQNAMWIKDDEANAFNTYFQLHVNLPSRLRPRTTVSL